jgi:hypothetical protein
LPQKLQVTISTLVQLQIIWRLSYREINPKLQLAAKSCMPNCTKSGVREVCSVEVEVWRFEVEV